MYVWDLEWSHMLLFNIPNDNSSAAIATISVQGDYSRVIPLTNDTKPLNYNAIFKERTSNNSSNSTFIITEEIFNGTRNLIKQDIRTPSHSKVELKHYHNNTTKYLPYSSNPYVPHNKNDILFPPKKSQSTVKPVAIPKY